MSREITLTVGFYRILVYHLPCSKLLKGDHYLRFKTVFRFKSLSLVFSDIPLTGVLHLVIMDFEFGRGKTGTRGTSSKPKF